MIVANRNNDFRKKWGGGIRSPILPLVVQVIGNQLTKFDYKLADAKEATGFFIKTYEEQPVIDVKR